MTALFSTRSCTILKAIINYKQAHDGISPSYDELAAKTGMSKSVLQQHIHILLGKGLLHKTPGPSRNLAVAGGKWSWEEERPFPPGRLADILKTIIDYKTTHDGNAPGHRDIAEKLGLAYAGSIKAYLDTLTEMGYLTTIYASDRNIMIVGGVWSYDQSLIEARCPQQRKQGSLFSLDVD
ncbi:MAG: MarR family transcriptional regulator [Anaerolineales bacterium]|nr:MarR family transcriptional regulator [Anaerolineales bacterium]